MEAIQIIKKAGGSLKDSYLDEGYVGLLFSLWQWLLVLCIHSGNEINITTSSSLALAVKNGEPHRL
jgi:hypothetical protein